MSSLFDLAPGGVYHAAPVTSRAVRSYRTLSLFAGPKPWRSTLCGTFPKVTLAGRYPAPWSPWSPDFPPPAGYPTGGDHLTLWQIAL